MVDTVNTYSLANRDVLTGSFPKKGKAKFKFSLGQEIIMNTEVYSSISDSQKKIHQIEKDIDNCALDMLSHEGTFSKSQGIESALLSDEKNHLSKVKMDYDLLVEHINNEESRVIARGYNIPTLSSSKSDLENKWEKISTKMKAIFKVGSKIAIIETFLFFMLYSVLRDHKSMLEIGLRFASTTLIVICLHLASNKYFSQSKKRYVVYILFAALCLLSLIIGIPIIEQIWPELLETTSNLSGLTFNVGTVSESASNSTTPNSIGTFFIKYDYLLGILCYIIFLVIGFLDRGNIVKEKPSDQIASPIANLLSLYERRKSLKSDIKSAEEKVRQLQNKPSDLISQLDNKLNVFERKIIDLENDKKILIADVDRLFRALETELKSYQIDFMDIFKNESASSFVEVDWPIDSDIKKYLKLD